MENSLIKIAEDFNFNPENLEHIIYQKVMERARKIYQEILSLLDDEIKDRRDKDFSIVRFDKTWYTTMLGSVRVKRRYYRAPDGSYHYLLDELVGMEKYQHTSRSVQSLTLEMAAQMPFRRAGKIMERTTPVSLSHQTISRTVERVMDKWLDNRDQTITHFISTGEIPFGEGIDVGRLLVEADGVMIPLQGEGRKRAEARLAISYEGHEKVGHDRYRTCGKQVFADITGSFPFWSAMTLKLNQNYDLSGCDIVLGGDGAGWIKQGADYFNSSYHLCRFHLNRNLTRTLGYDVQSLKAVKEAVGKGDVSEAANLLDGMAARARGDKRRDIASLSGYIKANASGITSGASFLGGLRGTGAIEGNIDKVIVRRMKNQGMSWSIKGARRMLCLRTLWYEDRIGESLTYDLPPKPYTLPKKRVRKVIDKKLNANYSSYFTASVPALSGPHASRPWVKVLKSITGGL